MTLLLLVIAILLVGGTALLASGRALPGWAARRRADGPGSAAGGALTAPVPSLPPVLLPENPSAVDVDALRFGLGLRGYRMDQVDEVLDRLAAALEQRDATIGDLRRQLTPDPPRGSTHA